MTNQRVGLATYQSRNYMSEPKISDEVEQHLRLNTLRRDPEGAPLCAIDLAKRYRGTRLHD